MREPAVLRAATIGIVLIAHPEVQRKEQTVERQRGEDEIRHSSPRNRACCIIRSGSSSSFVVGAHSNHQAIFIQHAYWLWNRLRIKHPKSKEKTSNIVALEMEHYGNEFEPVLLREHNSKEYGMRLVVTRDLLSYGRFVLLLNTYWTASIPASHAMSLAVIPLTFLDTISRTVLYCVPSMSAISRSLSHQRLSPPCCV